MEDKANGSAIIDTLRGEIGGIVTVNPQDSKEARAHAAAPDLQAGNCCLPKTDWANDLIEEAAQFPNGRHDNQVDAWTQAAARFRASAHSGIYEFYREEAVLLYALYPTQNAA